MELILGVVQSDAILRPPWPGDAGHDSLKIKLHVLAVARLNRGVVPEALLLGVRLDQGNLLCTASGEAQVVQCDLVNREHGRRGAELGAHVSNGCSVSQWHVSNASSVELDKLADNSVRPKHLGDGQNHIGCGDACRDHSRELESHNPRNQHRHGLTQHGRLGFDSANTPAQHAKPIDHGGVGVGSHTGVGERLSHSPELLRVGHLGQVLDVHLVDDSGARGHHLEVVECGLPPPQELVALAIAFILNVDVAGEGVWLPEQVGNHRVVNHQFGRRERVYFARVATQIDNCLAHGREVHDAGNTGEVLEDNACWSELNLGGGFRFRIPTAQRTDLLFGDVGTIFSAQQILQEDLQAKGQRLVALDTGRAVNLVVFAPDIQAGLSTEAVE